MAVAIMIGLGPKKKKKDEKADPIGPGLKFGFGNDESETTDEGDKEKVATAKGGDPESTEKKATPTGKPVIADNEIKGENEKNNGKQGALSSEGKKVMASGKSMFHDQSESCSNCEYFDAMGNDGVGECKKGVPEADFNQSDPSGSWCRFYEKLDPTEHAGEVPSDEVDEEKEAASDGV